MVLDSEFYVVLETGAEVHELGFEVVLNDFDFVCKDVA